MITCPKCKTPIKEDSEIVETGVATIYRVVRDSEDGFTFIKENDRQTEDRRLVLCCASCCSEVELPADALEDCEILTEEC